MSNGQANSVSEKFLKSQPDDSWELSILGWDYEQERMPELAVAKFRRAVEVTKDTPFNSFYLAALGHAYAMAAYDQWSVDELLTLATGVAAQAI